MSFSFSALLRLHLPFSTSISERKQHKAALAARSCSGGDIASSIFPLSSPLPLASPCQAVQQAGNRAAGPVSWTSQEEGRNGLGRREAIGLGVCLNAFAFFFQGASGGRGVEAAAAPALAEEGQCSFAVAPSGLAFCDRLVGVGAAATRGQLIKAHYVGKLVDGKVFDSSYSRGKPLTFRVGVGEVIKGWDQGILGDEGIPPMLSGGKRTLRIPPELAYGARGAGCRGGDALLSDHGFIVLLPYFRWGHIQVDYL
ncbi:hypothetical protein Taro_028086 [Colocasia esculenta]|uniref:peptidylprolyl isomerase n=1 Tax=Colocasia esculenta TaxID=4460 RepID=A0A843VM19_COLES|nr:hypothetical protein [Colocasia esculenta]